VRRLLLALTTAATAILAWGLLAASVATADGGPHGGYGPTAYGCASCHKTHTAQAAKLLTVNKADLCLSCHDGVGASNDVYDGARLATRLTARNAGTSGAAGQALKGGGFKFARIDSKGSMVAPFVYVETTSARKWTFGAGGPDATDQQLLDPANWVRLPGAALPDTDPGLPVNSAHIKGTPTGASSTVNALVARNTVWGSGAINSGAGGTWNLTCTDCHDPHGGGTYRILRPLPVAVDTSKGGLNVGATMVALPDDPAVGKSYVTTSYWDQYKLTVTTPWTGNQMAQWCSTCHTRYQATTGEMRANSGDSIFAYRHVSDGTVFQAKTGSLYSGTEYRAQCLQCHVAHGANTKTDFRGAGSYRFPDGSVGDPDLAGPMTGADSVLLKIDQRGTCVACHGGIGGVPSS
jgi:predicted CXXCH cytochrome family protein